MMYLSQLLIDTGDNPDRPRPGRDWLGQRYRVHQRLSMAFPSRGKRDADPQFLAPWNPDDFQKKDERALFLYRIDNQVHGDDSRAVILVQSELEPDWNYAFHNFPGALAVPPQCKPYNPQFHTGERLRYRIRMNLTQKRSGGAYSANKDGSPRKQGKRVQLTWDDDKSAEEAIGEWFGKKLQTRGATLNECRLIFLGWDRMRTPVMDANDESIRYRAALLEGALEVKDGVAFGETLRFGIGSAKAFGFGLLSVYPERGDRANP